MLQQSHTPLTNGIMSFLEASEDHDLAPIGIGSMHEQAKKLAEYGRHGDIYFVHAAEGETVVPLEVLNANPKVKDMLFNQMREMGLDPEEFVVGNELNSINPVTGMPEFFFSKVWRSVKKVASKAWKGIKAAAPYVLPLVFSAFGVPFLSAMAPGLFGAGSFGAAFLGSGIGTLAAGGSMKDALKAGAMAGAMNFGLSGARSAFSGGDFMQGAMKSVYNPQAATFRTQLERFTGALDPSGPAGSFDAFVGGQAPGAAPTVAPPVQPSEISAVQPPDISAFADMSYGPGAVAPTPSVPGVDINLGADLTAADPYTKMYAPKFPDPAEMYDLSRGMKPPETLLETVGRKAGEYYDTAGDLLFRGGETAGDVQGAVDAARLAEAKSLGFNSVSDAMRVPKAAEAVMEAGRKAGPGMLATYGPTLALGTAGLAAYQATQSESEDDRKKREAEEAAEKERERQARLREWHKTTGAYKFAQTQIGGPSNPDYYRYRIQELSQPLFGAAGGMAEYPRRDLLVEGPGTERSDDIPAMLSDGEFVMNARAVRGADPSGRGNRYAGANNLYNMMRNFEMRS